MKNLTLILCSLCLFNYIQAQTNAKSTEPEKKGSEKIYTQVDQMPEFPGNLNAFYRYLSRTVQYPVIAMENGIQGTVICRFVVNKDGTINDITLLRSVDPSLDKEAIRVLKIMPKWIPAVNGGKTVSCYFTVPIKFHLSEEGESSASSKQTITIPSDTDTTSISLKTESDSNAGNENIYFEMNGKRVSQEELMKIEIDKIKSTCIENDVILPNGKKGRKITVTLKN